MNEAKHTPGPWWVEVDTDPEASWERKWPTIHAEKYEVVGCEGLYGDYETDMANARLIAAAPDLLDALQGIIGYFDSGNNVPVSQATIKARSDEVKSARAAIAKATGGSA